MKEDFKGHNWILVLWSVLESGYLPT